MVIDTINNASFYYGISKKIESALKYLQENDFSTAQPENYNIDGADIYAIVQEYETSPKEFGIWEAHQCYIDIQYIVKGTESIGFANLQKMKVKQKYNDEKDVALFEGEGEFLSLGEGTFIIFTTSDVHMPGIRMNDSEFIKKVVVKVSV